MDELSIRKAKIEDARFLFDLRTDPHTSAMFFSKAPSDFSEHQRWLERKLKVTRFGLFILEYGGKPVAYFRIDEDADTSVCVHPRERGKGFAAEAIKRGLGYYLSEHRDSKGFLAKIKKENLASVSAFKKAGFQIIPNCHVDGEEVFCLQYQPATHVLAASKNWSEIQVAELIKQTRSLFFLIKNKEDLTQEKLKILNPEFLFFPHWSYLIPSEIYKHWPCIMFHMTDLPYGRGGSPLQNLILRGHKETILTCFHCDGGIDTGPIYMKLPLNLDDSAKEIFQRANNLIQQMIVSFLQEKPQSIPQKGEPVLFKRRKEEESEIKEFKNLEGVYDHIRMLDAEGYPHAFLVKDNFILEFSDAILQDNVLEAKVRIKKK